MLQWVSVLATTGDVLADLPDLKVDGVLKQTLMRYETATAKLPIASAPENWRTATRIGAAFLVCLDEAGNPLWGGLVKGRLTNIGPTADLELVTAEAYFDRVYLGDETYTDTAQNLIAKDLVETYAQDWPGEAYPGIPIRVQVHGGDGELRTKAWEDVQDKTLYSALQDFSGLLGGPEWYVSWEWLQTAPGAIRRLGMVFNIADQLGTEPGAGLVPHAQFELPGPVTWAELYEGYGEGDGANDVTATSSEVDGVRPESQRLTPNMFSGGSNDGRPRFEHRWQPDTDITSTATLTSHATRAYLAMKDGVKALAIEADRSEAPPLNVDWGLGDIIGYKLVAPAWPEPGLQGTARVVGYELTDKKIVPLVSVVTLTGLED